MLEFMYMFVVVYLAIYVELMLNYLLIGYLCAVVVLLFNSGTPGVTLRYIILLWPAYVITAPIFLVQQLILVTKQLIKRK